MIDSPVTIIHGRDGSGNYVPAAVDAGGLLRQKAELVPLTSMQVTQTAVNGTAVQLASTPLTGRKTVSIKAITSDEATTGLERVYIGTSSSVTTTNGYPLKGGDSLDLELDGTQAVWAIGSSSGQRVAVLEIA